MSVSAINNQFPLFGWNPTTLIQLRATVPAAPGSGNQLHFDSAGSTTISDQISPRVLRPAGLHNVGLFINIPANAGSWTGVIANQVTLILEGSNDGVETVSAEARDVNNHWTTIAELDIDQLFNGVNNVSVVGQVRLMGTILLTDPGRISIISGDPNVNVRRYKYLRVRGVNLTISAPLEWFIDIQLVGIGQDSEQFDRDSTLIRPAGGPTLTTGSEWKRPGGTRWMTVQAIANEIVLDGLVDVRVVIQGALVEGGTISTFGDIAPLWFTISEAEMTATGDVTFLEQNGVPIIDMDPFQYFRYQISDSTGAPGAGTRFTIGFDTNFDGNDVFLDGVSGTDFESDLSSTFLRLIWGTPEAQVGGGVGSTIDIELQMLDITGLPLREERTIIVTLTDEDPATGANGIIAPSVNHEIASATVGTITFGAGSPVAVIETTANGVATLRIERVAGAGITTCTLAAQNFTPDTSGGSGVEGIVGQLLISAERAPLSFAA